MYAIHNGNDLTDEANERINRQETGKRPVAAESEAYATARHT